MNAEAALKAARAALEAGRALTTEEFQSIRDGINDPNTDMVVRGGLKELGAALERQSNARLLRDQARAAEERGRERLRKLDARTAAWQALPHITAAAFKTAVATNDATWKVFLQHLQDPDRGPAPRTFDPDGILTEHERLFGVGGQ